MTTEELKSKLIELGYDAHIVNVDCFDIHQAGRTHYLSHKEAETLVAADFGHPVKLVAYAVWQSPNYWYMFEP